MELLNPDILKLRRRNQRSSNRPQGTASMRQSRAVASLRKPVIVRKFTRDWFAGYAAQDFARESVELEVLDLNGKVVQVAWAQIKWVCYVRDLPSPSLQSEASNPERLLHKRFTTRPRTAGLWLRMTLTDGEHLEGLAANNRTLVESPGLLLTPPDTRSNTQRIYVPRTAIETFEVVGLIGAGPRKGVDGRRLADQPDLFPADLEES
jgi:hypothetical protein